MPTGKLQQYITNVQLSNETISICMTFVHKETSD